VKESLLAEFKLSDDPERAGQLGVANPFHDVEFDFTLARTSDRER
jgi:hydroxyquinol 1,2-dioxygenase